MIPFNRPYIVGSELVNIAVAIEVGQLAGDGAFTARCHKWIEAATGTHQALLTSSCTAALEMAAILIDVNPGDEVIMPSYTFVSTANAFVLRGAIPVFVDIRSDTRNIDESLIEDAITARTKAIVCVHYAGIACEMDTITDIGRRHGLHVVEDAAQGLEATYKGRALGTIGDLGTYSFHETKSVMCGEGGALLVNRPEMAARAEIIREKGTDRSNFLRGEVDKYTWRDLGSSFLPGEVTAAFLLAQLEQAQRITGLRLEAWWRYNSLLESLEDREILTRPAIPEGCEHNGHLYYVELNERFSRDRVLASMMQMGVQSTFHYNPLHLSAFGASHARVHGQLTITERTSRSLVRAPLWTGITPEQQSQVVDALINALESDRVE